VLHRYTLPQIEMFAAAAVRHEVRSAGLLRAAFRADDKQWEKIVRKSGPKKAKPADTIMAIAAKLNVPTKD
jgi:hypothetical protein